jgi:hypothetical protein
LKIALIHLIIQQTPEEDFEKESLEGITSQKLITQFLG